MLKRILYGAGFVLLLTLVVVLLFFRKKDHLLTSMITDAVTPDAILYLDQMDYDFFTGNFISDSEIWNALQLVAPGQRADSVVRRFAGQLSRVDLLQDLFSKKQMGISIHLVGKEQLVPVFYINYSGSFSEKEFRLIIEELLGDDAVIDERRYEAVTLCDVKGSNPWIKGTFTFVQINGLFIVSTHSVLVEEAIRNILTGENLVVQPGFSKIRQSAGRNVQGNLYINYPKLEELFYPMVGNNYRWKLSFPGAIADWGEADVIMKKDALALTGMVWSDDSLPRVLNLFKGQAPVKTDMPSYIPSNAISGLFLGISDLKKFKLSLLEYLSVNGDLAQFESTGRDLKERFGIAPLDDLFSLLDDEAGWFTTDDSDIGEQHVAVFETRSGSLAREMLDRWSDGVSSFTGQSSEELYSEYSVDAQSSFKIVHFEEPFYKDGFAARFFYPFFTVYDNLLLSGSSEQALTRAIYQNILHKTLNTDHSFAEVTDYLASKANVTFYGRPTPFLKIREPYMNSRAKGLLQEMETFTGGISGLIVQYIWEGDLFYQNISARYSVDRDEESLTVWESLLDTAAVGKPSIVVNANTQDKEVFVQDAGNTVYLVNSAGRILWRRLLDGPVMSEVYQIDYYNNGKLQYLFNTPGRIHLIDRNGNNVEKFPINLRSRATNPMGLFDYDTKGEYRIFIAGADRRIYVYDKSGNVLPGWNFGTAEKVVTSQIQHFRVKDKDYIVFSDAGRSYILDRQGRERVSLKSRIPVSPRNVFYLDMNIRENKPRLVNSDTAGNVVGFGFDGSVSVIMKNTATSEHYFRMQDMDQDGIGDYLFADGNVLTAFSGNGKKLFTYRIRGEIKFLPDIYRFSASDIKVGITESGQNRIYLINSDGSLHDGFPLEGNTRFSIGNFSGTDSRFNLIVGSINSFLYNYSIE